MKVHRGVEKVLGQTISSQLRDGPAILKPLRNAGQSAHFISFAWIQITASIDNSFPL